MPGGTGFTGRQFWGIQLTGVNIPTTQDNTGGEKQVRINSDTELHISNVVVDFGYLSHLARCSVSVGVKYETDPCDCVFSGEICRHQKKGQCVLCIIRPEEKCEANLDINFVGGKNLTFYFSNNCWCDSDSYNKDFTVNIFGYEVHD